MFTTGELYLERVTTGALTFDVEGKPSVSPMQHGAVFNFKTQESAKLFQGLMPETELKPATEYIRLFKAPEPKFDDRGELKRPKFLTVGFIEVDDLLFKTFAIFEISGGLPAAAWPFFDDEEE